MLLQEITDSLIRAASAAKNPIGAKFEMPYVEALVPQLRADSILIAYNGSKERGGTKHIAGEWQQQVNVTIDPNIQDPHADFLIAAIPKPLRISTAVDGLIYFGQKLSTQNWYKAFTRSEIANLYERGFLNDDSNIAYYLNGTNVEIYGDKFLTDFTIVGVFADPLSIASFNQYSSDYPISEDLYSIMEALFLSRMRVAIGQAADNIFDDAETDERRVIKGNIV
jgi:hypothetical protein